MTEVVMDTETSPSLVLLRTCSKCGLKAYTEEDLKKFKKQSDCLHGHQALCLLCWAMHKRIGKCKVVNLLKFWRSWSPDGVIFCYFCGNAIRKLSGWEGGALAVHSLDGDHANWKPMNKAPVHISCHQSYHRRRKLAAEVVERG